MLRKSLSGFVMTIVLVLSACSSTPVNTDKLQADSKAALQDLYAKEAETSGLGQKSKGILVFPSITKAGVAVGGQYGRGVLYVNGKVDGYYTTTGGSFGLQLGAETYGYVMFLLSDKALSDIRGGNFEVGVGPTVTVVEAGMGKNITTTTVQSDVYAFVFSQKGLMAGLGLQGNKISKIDN